MLTSDIILAYDLDTCSEENESFPDRIDGFSYFTAAHHVRKCSDEEDDDADCEYDDYEEKGHDDVKSYVDLMEGEESSKGDGTAAAASSKKTRPARRRTLTSAPSMGDDGVDEDDGAADGDDEEGQMRQAGPMRTDPDSDESSGDDDESPRQPPVHQAGQMRVAGRSEMRPGEKRAQELMQKREEWQRQQALQRQQRQEQLKEQQRKRQAEAQQRQQQRQQRLQDSGRRREDAPTDSSSSSSRSRARTVKGDDEDAGEQEQDEQANEEEDSQKSGDGEREESPSSRAPDDSPRLDAEDMDDRSEGLRRERSTQPPSAPRAAPSPRRDEIEYDTDEGVLHTSECKPSRHGPLIKRYAVRAQRTHAHTHTYARAHIYSKTERLARTVSPAIAHRCTFIVLYRPTTASSLRTLRGRTMRS